MAAGRGVLALFVGNRQAGGYFDLTPRGLAGSFIALLLVSVLNAAMPTIMGIEDDSITRALLVVAILFAMQLGFAAIVLRQVRRQDGFLPYLVADNWATFFLTLISTALVAAGLANDFTLVALGVVVIVVEVNIARLIVTLTPLQIAMFLIAQMVGVSIGLVLVAFLFPLPSELVEAAANAAASAAGV